jgi:hypothetical protein
VIEYSDGIGPLFPFDLVRGDFALTRAELVEFQLGNSALDADVRAVIQVLALFALEPNVFAGF